MTRGQRLACFLVCFCGISLLSAQTAISSLPPDHHDVYNAFFQYQVSWQQWAGAQAAANSVKAAQLSSQFAQLVSVDPAEVSAVSAVCADTANRLAALAAERASRPVANGKLSDHAATQFELRRQQIILSGVMQLRRRLTRASWSGLHTYINIGYRLYGQTLSLGGN